MKSGGRIYVLFSTVGRNTSADNVGRFAGALAELTATWPLREEVVEEVVDNDNTPAELLQTKGRASRWGNSSSRSAIAAAMPCESVLPCIQLNDSAAPEIVLAGHNEMEDVQISSL